MPAEKKPLDRELGRIGGLIFLLWYATPLWFRVRFTPDPPTDEPDEGQS